MASFFLDSSFAHSLLNFIIFLTVKYDGIAGRAAQLALLGLRLEDIKLQTPVRQGPLPK